LSKAYATFVQRVTREEWRATTSYRTQAAFIRHDAFHSVWVLHGEPDHVRGPAAKEGRGERCGVDLADGA